MPEYLAPGVYVEEVDTGSKSIEGVSTSTAGFVGMTKRGPTTGPPELVTSFADFERRFGGHFEFTTSQVDKTYLPYAVEGFFTNGGKRAYIKRVVPKASGAATPASRTFRGGIATRLTADAASGATTIKVASMRGIDVTTPVTLTMTKDGVVSSSGARTVSAYNPTTNELTIQALPSAFEAAHTVVEAGTRTNTIALDAKDPGSWGRDIRVATGYSTAASSLMVSVAPGNTAGNNWVVLQSVAGFYIDAFVEFDRGLNKVVRKVLDIQGSSIKVDGGALAAADLAFQSPATATRVSTWEFDLTVTHGAQTESYLGLTLENVPGRFYKERLATSTLIATQGTSAVSTLPTAYPMAANALEDRFDTGGLDGAASVVDADYIGADNGPGQRTGLMAMGDIDVVSIVAIPGQTSQAIQNALISHCELLMDRFAILDPANAQQTLPQITQQRLRFDTKYAAIYYPRLVVAKATGPGELKIPPSGHMAGIYARVDVERGVHKAPANEVVRGILGLEANITKGEHDILNPLPNNVNVLRDFRDSGRGMRVYGARCITSDSDWKYVNVRRLFIFLEESIQQGTEWVVFEPNDEPLWARVRQSVEAFLTRVWRDGALQGSKPEQAFFVACDHTTMSQDDIDQGKLIMKIGVAAVKPAEYVIIRIGQWAGGSSVSES